MCYLAREGSYVAGGTHLAGVYKGLVSGASQYTVMEVKEVNVMYTFCGTSPQVPLNATAL